ncbi:WD40 repeat domain-containing protein, partial [Microvirga sp. 0TCS3.31]
MQLWNTDTGIKLGEFHGGTQDRMALSPDGSRLVIGTAFERAARLLTASDGRELQRFAGSVDWVHGLAVSPDNSKVFTASDSTLELWDATSGTRLKRMVGDQGWISMAVFSADGLKVLSGGGDGTARLWDVSTGNEILRIEQPPFVDAVAISLTGKLLLTGNFEGEVLIWDAVTGTKLRRLTGHSGSIVSAQFSPDDKRVATASKDGTVIISDVQLATELIRLISTQSSWITANSTGWFDTGRLESIEGVHWVLPDDPFRPLPPEIFMRDYYEPRLLPRLLACHEAEAAGEADACKKAFKPVRPLGELNRVQPAVRIVGVRSSSTPDLALVDVEVAAVEDASQKNGKTRTDVYDLRLFRNG